MKTIKGGAADRAGKGYGPNLEEIAQESTDPFGLDKNYADVVANPGKHRIKIPGGSKIVKITKEKQK